MVPKTFKELKYLIRSDLYRYGGQTGLKTFLKHYFLIPGFRYSFWLRLCAYLRHGGALKRLFFYPARLILRRNEFRFGISISDAMQVGSGLCIGHFGGIVIHGNTVIGRDCNISHGVTIGWTTRGERRGAPVIGDRVYIASGAKIIGHIVIGNDVAIGANCVVTKDVPDHAVVVGVPGHVISMDGSQGYIAFTDYDA